MIRRGGPPLPTLLLIWTLILLFRAEDEEESFSAIRKDGRPFNDELRRGGPPLPTVLLIAGAWKSVGG